MDKQKKDEANVLENNPEINKNCEQQEDFPWVLPAEEMHTKTEENVIDIKEYRSLHNNKRSSSVRLPINRKKKSYHFTNGMNAPKGSKWIVSVLAAILIGTGFGLVMLTLFTNSSEMTTQTQSTSPDKSVRSEEAVTPPSLNVEDNQPLGESGAQPIFLTSPLYVHVVQGGAFSTVDSAESVSQSIQQSGKASAIFGDTDPIYLFIGIGADKATVQEVSSFYSAQGQETYVKPITIGGGELSGSADDQILLEKGRKLFENIVATSSGLITGDSVSVDEWNAMEKEVEQIQTSMTSSRNEEIRLFSNQVISAFHALQGYRSNPQLAKLWSVQQTLLNGLTAYNNITK